MTETKLHYKLYKTKHGWVTATIAATALAIPVIGGSVTSHASADTTATTGTQTVTSGSNAVTATTASATSVTSSTQAVTPDSSKLDQAVQNAKATANVTVNQTPTQTVTGSTVAEAKQKAEQDYQNQATQINQKVANQKANNDATNAANSFNMDNSKKRELDQAVQNAKATANVNVKQTQTQIYNTGVSGVENTKNKINNDYSTQINNINQAVSAQKAKNDAYNKAVAEANTLNSTADATRKKLDDAIKAAQAVKGVTVIDGGTSTATVSVSDFEAKKKQIQDQNTQQTNDINAQIQQYKSDLQNYLNKINNNSSVVSSNEIIQNLTLANEWDAKVSYQVTGNNIKQSSQTLKTGDTAYGHGISIPQGKQITLTNFISDHPQTFKVIATFTGLKNSSYQSRKITKLVEVYTITPNTSSRENALGIYSDPTNGFEETNSKVNVSYEFYYEDGTPVNFKKGTAYLALGSLNNYQNGQDHYEYAKVISGGKALGLAGSSVSVHNGNTLYSTYPNTARESEYGADSHYNTNPQHSPDFDKYYGWDTGWVNSKAFYGSGLVSLEGSKYTFEVGVDGEKYFTTDELRNNLPANHLWYNMATVIPRTDIQKPELTVRYKHTNVALEKPTPTEVTYHYDRMNPASIEDRTDISYHYNKISVLIPNPTKKADKEGKTLIAGDESTQHISQYTGVNQKLDKFAVGDAIQYTNDGRLPVSFDLSKWTVTTSNGTNVTAQGKFTQYDKTFEGKKYHVVSWSPTNVSSLKDNETYTLNTVLKTLNDGITDGEIDRAVGGGDGVTFGEAHGYDEFNPTTDKAWIEGSQTVNGKIEINEDIAHAKVTMTMPDPAKLANKLSNVAITDNYSKFANLVTVTGANVYENERNATSDYTIVNNNKVVTATRKNPATANGGTVSLVVDFKVNPDVPSGTKLVNSGSGTINTQTVPTPDAQIVTFTQKPTKHWIEGSQVVDGKTYINNDIVTTQVDMNLPDPKQLAKTLSYVSIGDNYRDFADKTVLQSYKVFENGTDVTSQYTITNQDGILQAVRKNAATTPGGKVSLIATFAINHDVKSGTKLTNRGFGRINNHTVDTNTPQIVTFKQDTSKHWVEGSQVVDDKTYINEDMVHGQVTMTLPNKDSLAKALTDVTLVDDYSDYANKVSYVNAQVFENGTDVTSQYTITNAGNKITATRKNPGATPSGSVRLVANFKLNNNLPSGTKLINRGSGRINNNTVNTNEAKILTYVQSTDKHWVEGSQKVDGKTYIDGDTIHGQVTMTLPDKNTLAKALSTIQVIDDYSKFAKMVDYKSAQVLENGKDVTSEYNISNAYGQVVATRKNATATPSGNVTLNVTWTIHKDVPSGTQLVNSGSGRINSHTVPTPDRNIVTYKSDTDKHWVEGTQVVDGKTYIDNDFVHGQVTMTLPDPTKLAEKLKHVSVTDDYSRFAKMVDYKSAQVLENGKDVTAQYNITNANGKVVATRKDASTTPNGSVTLNVTWRIHTDVKSGTVFVNGGDGRINDETVPTPDRNIVTYKQDGFKDWINSQNQVVNDKTYIDNDVIHAKLVTTLPNPKALATPLTKVQLDDDYTSYAKMVDYVGARVLENGTDVTNQYNIVNANGHVTATRKDPSKASNGNAELRVDFRIHADVPSGTKLFNSGSVTLNTETIPTPTPSVETYRQDTDKHWVEGSQVVDGKTYIDGDNVSAQVSMTLPEPSKLAEKLKRVVVTDDFSKFADKVDYKSAKVLENGKDVTAQYDIKVANGKVIATRKDASTTPAGKVVLQAFWKVHNDIESNTQLVNSGSGQINDEVVPTPDRTIVTYKQDTEKHWRDDGGQIVDGKIAIDDDIVTARVDMTLPKGENLAKPLDKIQLVDDYSKFADKVTLQAVHVYENGKDVTDQYDIHVENGRVVATRKDASKVYDHTGVANATMKATLKANKALTVNDLVHTASANVNDSKVSTVNRLAFTRLFAKSFITSNLAVTSDNNIKSQIDMAVPTNVDAKTPMTVTSDYSNFAKYVNVKDATVYENGKNVTADYTIKDDKAGHVTATKKAGSESDGGQVSLVVDYEVNHGIPTGTILENHGSGTLNGQDVPTNTPSITTYTQDTNKHWVEGDQNVDGKIYVNGSTAHAQVSMTLPDQSKLINKLSNVSIDDDYSKFAKLVDYKSAKVLENGKDVTSEYTIKNANGHVTAVRKDASKTPAGNVQLLVDFEIHKDVKSGTELVNGGSGTLNKNTVPTNTPSIWTYTPDGEKHWVLDNNVTDNKIYFSGDKAVAQVSVDLPDASKLATPLNKLVLVDNYSDFADKVKLDSAKVLENGKDVTSEYDLTNKDGKVVATRKDAAKTPSGKAVLVTTFTINNGIENATALHNKGSVTVDSITDEVPDTPIVVFTPKAHKDVELGGDVKGDTENSVDGSLILNGSVVTYPITTSDLPAERAEDITKRVVKDTLDKNVEFVGFKAWIENDKGELEDVTSHYKLDKNGQDLTFTEDSYLLGLYNKDKSKQTHTPIIDLVVKVKGDSQKITNKATALTNDNVTETNEVSVDTPAKPTPTKVDKNEKGVNIDGKNVLPGSVNNYELTMDLTKFKGIKVTDQDLAKGFYFVDDYPEEALDVDPQTFTYKTVDGKTVKGLSAKLYQSLSEVPENVATALKANSITPSGAFVLISADDPAQFFKDYVETGTNIKVNAPMKVKEGFAGKYQNKAWQLTFGQGEATEIVSNNVPKIDPKKDIVISADNRTSLNNHTIELGQNFDYLLKGGILDKDQGHDIYEYKWVDDYDENHDQYNGQFIAPLTVDVTLKDGTVLKAGTDISNHVSQNIDTKTGSVEFSVDKDFLDKVDFDKSGFAADILMSVKRIKAGEVDNTYTNIINGQKFGSNTVHSTTPEPKVPETPATPKTPETPSVPVAQTQTPATPQPVKMVTSTPAPKAPESPALPQTGEANDTLAEEVVGFAAIVAALGMAGTSLKKRKD